MKRGLLISLILLLVAAPASAALEPIQEPIVFLFGLTQPTAYTLRAGEWIVGGSLIYGITDWMMIGTDPFMNLIFLNLYGRVNIGYIPALKADLALSWGVLRTGPFLAALVPFVDPITVLFGGVVASAKATDELTLHTGFNVATAGLDGIPLLPIVGPVFLGMDYELSPAIRLLGSFDVSLDAIRLKAGIMMRWQWLWGATLQLGGVGRFDFDPAIYEEPFSFHPEVWIFWRF